MANVVPLIVSFGTGMVKRYNQRKKAASAAEYEQILLDDKQAHELEMKTEDRNHDYKVADYKHAQSMSKLMTENQLNINDKLAEFNLTTNRDEQIAIQKQLDDLAMQKDLYTRKESLETHKNTLTSAANAVAEANGFEVFGSGNTSFKLDQYPDANGNPNLGPKWDAKKMEDLNELWAEAGFKEIVLKMDDIELQKFKTYTTQLFNKYRVSNANYDKEKAKYVAWARIKPNAAGKGFFQNLFDKEKYPEELGMMESYDNSTSYIRGLSFNEAKKMNKNISHVFTKASEDGTYDYILTLDDLKDLYPNTPIEDVMALAEITRTYNPELAEGKTGIDGNMETIYSLNNRPTDLLGVKYANAYARKGMTSDGQNLVNFWNEHPEVYGPSDGYEMQQDGTERYVGIDHEARLENLALGVLPSLIDDTDPAFVSVLGSKNALDAQKRIIGGNDTMIADIKNIGIQGTTTVNLINNILTTYDPKYGGNAITGATLDLRVLIEGFTKQVGLLQGVFDPKKAESALQHIYTKAGLPKYVRDGISTFEYAGKEYNVAAEINNIDPNLQLAAQRKFFATALNYTVSMILQGGTGGKTISDTDYLIMDRAMYNGLFTSQGLNLAALEAIFKTVELPVLLAQYKTDLDNPNAIQNMQAAMKYERLINFNGKQEYYKLRDRLNGYSDESSETALSKDIYFMGNAYPGQKSRVSSEKIEGKNIVYFTYFKGNTEETRMPMTLEDVKKYYPIAYGRVKGDYISFDNPVFDVYRNQFRDTENRDSSKIVKDKWNLFGDAVNPDDTPDEGL